MNPVQIRRAMSNQIRLSRGSCGKKGERVTMGLVLTLVLGSRCPLPSSSILSLFHCYLCGRTPWILRSLRRHIPFVSGGAQHRVVAVRPLNIDGTPLWFVHLTRHVLSQRERLATNPPCLFFLCRTCGRFQKTWFCSLPCLLLSLLRCAPLVSL